MPIFISVLLGIILFLLCLSILVWVITFFEDLDWDPWWLFGIVVKHAERTASAVNKKIKKR